MGYNNWKEKGIIGDIESGGTSSEDDTGSDSVLGKKQAKELLKKIGTSSVLDFNGSSEVEPSAKSKGILGETSEESRESVRLMIEEKNPVGLQNQNLMPVAEKKHEKERPKIGKSKKASKPPRPPKGPTLDAVDMKLVKEISLLATKKRERIERMKALKKMKAAKSTSSSPSSCSTFPAMIITILFCLVIIFQGLGSRNSSPVIFPGAPEPAMMNEGLISVEFYRNGLSNDDRVPNSYSPVSAGQLSGLEFRSQE
ncbi:Hypothetical predicted protein [Olea europaea subsp. europaea]|uniref:Transmembrane protein n=1 Tax=Olea europaea subsp. europaea TaxID=158383 RepID=A0A8S0T5Q6_OLEEU|nr:Hypothetical predicted protein [Olea europaea subsp. europaea]